MVVYDDGGDGDKDLTNDTVIDAELCFGEAPVTYTTTIDVGPFTPCGVYLFTNTATIVAVDDLNDSGESTSSSYTVTINVPCPTGCTLTQGYWKTHNVTFPGGAPPDETWYLLGDIDRNGTPEGEGELFFLSDQTFYQVMWTPPGGNVYYNLAHQYIAAWLNTIGPDGADDTAIAEAFAEATALFERYTPAQVAALKGKAGKAERAEFIRLAGILGSFNEGDIGPGHCDEDSDSESGRASAPMLLADRRTSLNIG